MPGAKSGARGDRPPSVKETYEQSSLVTWFFHQHRNLLVFSIPNGAHLSGTPAQRAAQMARLKAEGLRPGVPDLFVPKWRLFIEMKRARGGRLSAEQRQIHADLIADGYTVIIAKGFDDAVAQIKAFRGATA
jgi:hypothetical protein